MAKLSKEKTQQILLIALVTLSALSGVWFLLIEPQLGILKDKAKKKEVAESKVHDAEKLAKQADLIERELEDAQQKLAGIESEMASGDYFMWSFKFMEAFMAAHNLQIIDSERPREEETGLFAQFPYKAISFTERKVPKS